MKFRIQAFSLLLIFYTASCNNYDEEDSNSINFTRNTDRSVIINPEFNRVFECIDSFPLTLESHRNISEVTDIRFNSKGNLFIVDYERMSVVEFNESGFFISEYGKKGKGPSEFVHIGSTFIDYSDNLWVFDFATKRLTQFTGSYSSATEELSFTGHFIDEFVVVDSIIITYSNYNDFLLHKFDFQARKLEEKLKLDEILLSDGRLQIFLARFHGGGLALDRGRNSFYAIYPGTFTIFKFSNSMVLIKAIKSEGLFEYRQNPPPFPSTLDPTEMDDRHIAYYNSFLHVGKLYFLERDDLLVVSVYKEDLWEHLVEFYINVYTDDGVIIAEGLKLPAGYRLVGSFRNYIYLVREEKMLENGNIRPLKIYKYKYFKPEL